MQARNYKSKNRILSPEECNCDQDRKWSNSKKCHCKTTNGYGKTCYTYKTTTPVTKWKTTTKHETTEDKNIHEWITKPSTFSTCKYPPCHKVKVKVTKKPNYLKTRPPDIKSTPKPKVKISDQVWTTKSTKPPVSNFNCKHPPCDKTSTVTYTFKGKKKVTTEFRKTTPVGWRCKSPPCHDFRKRRKIKVKRKITTQSIWTTISNCKNPPCHTYKVKVKRTPTPTLSFNNFKATETDTEPTIKFSSITPKGVPTTFTPIPKVTTTLTPIHRISTELTPNLKITTTTACKYTIMRAICVPCLSVKDSKPSSKSWTNTNVFKLSAEDTRK